MKKWKKINEEWQRVSEAFVKDYDVVIIVDGDGQPVLDGFTDVPLLFDDVSMAKKKIVDVGEVAKKAKMHLKW